MTERLETLKYTFSVEGETERWYLEWLQNQVNSCSERKRNVSILGRVCQNPMKFAKTVNSKSTPSAVHLCDMESNEKEYEIRFRSVLDELKTANREKGIEYTLGYSNLTFELWMILHRKNCNAPINDRHQYLENINQVFGERFRSLTEYKREKDFKRCLSKLQLRDVFEAVKRAELIVERKKKRNEGDEVSYRGFRYYRNNPSLSIHESIGKILTESGLTESKVTV